MNRLSLIIAVALAAAACGGTSSSPTPSTTVPTVPGVAIVPAGGGPLYLQPGSEPMLTAIEDLVLPITSVSGVWYEVVTSCGTNAWVRYKEMDFAAPSAQGEPGPGFDLSQAVIVVDPGHGGRDLGAKGASGSWESQVNLEIAERLRDRLERGQAVLWDTGEIIAGSAYPAVKQVWMSRSTDGPLGGDIELGLAYRAELANGVGADALLAIHNNTSPARTGSIPGSDVFYSVDSPGSDRLASLIHQELVVGFSALGSEFSQARVTGVKARVLEDTGDDYYGLLRRTEPPSVIIEGLYISEPSEEQILTSMEGQQTYADAVYRGLIRFLTTNETGSPIQDPVPFEGDVGTVTNTACEIPQQP
jgi:N-acetylmuramoyl-L-alanine amidase